MLSRVANSVYWMFRYLERAQNIARFINADFNQFLENRDHRGNLWMSLVAVTGDQEFFLKRCPHPDRDSIIHFLTLDEEYASSIYRCVVQARENARSIREIISSEMWEAVNSLYLTVRAQARSGIPADPFSFCRQVIDGCYLLIGLFYSTMNRGEAWHFGRLGMLLERADKTSRILDVKYFILLPDPSWVGSTYDNTQWAALLKAVSGLEMYRKVHRRLSPRDVAEFLLYDRDFPRSVLHCVLESETSLRVLSAGRAAGALNSLTSLRAELETGNATEVLRAGLHDELDDLQTRLNKVDDELFGVFFAAKLRHGDALAQTQSQA